MRPFVVGTAGHIDHGKSSLVKALTGIDPDRLPEEKRRGITIQLGFAHGELQPGVRASFVDVPGHERFVREMVAGAQGVDLVLFVVALDEGVMPQTREHAEICRLLGVTRAVVALTKSDLAPSLDPAWPSLVEEDVRRLGALFENAPLIRVSARTGDGLEKVRHSLIDLARNLPDRSTRLPALLPIDRAFTLVGHGTVVTGTLVAGAIELNQEVSLVVPGPGGARIRDGLRVRSLQSHGAARAKCPTGERVAVNLPGVEVGEVSRGAALVGPGASSAWTSSSFDVELEPSRGAASIRNRSKLHLHLGTAQAIATVDLLGLSSLEAGAKAVACLRLDRAVSGVRGQRFVLRSDGRAGETGRTVAGGRVLGASTKRRRAKDRSLVEALSGDGLQAARALLREAGAMGLSLHELRLRLAEEPGSLSGVMREGERLFDPAAVDGLVERIGAEVRARPGRSREEVRASLGPAVATEAFQLAIARLGTGFVVKDTIDLATRVRSGLEARVWAALEAGGRTPPTAGELAESLPASAYDVGGALRGLERRGDVVRLTETLFMASSAAASCRAEVVRLIEEKGPMTTLEIKERLGVSRKFLIPLCEWLDREHVTLRVGENRSLRRPK